MVSRRFDLRPRSLLSHDLFHVVSTDGLGDPPAPTTFGVRDLCVSPPATHHKDSTGSSKHLKQSIQRWGRIFTAADNVSGALIYFLVVFTPWALGTTQTWSIWTANVIAFVLGVLLLIKKVALAFSSIRPPRWAGGNESKNPWMRAILGLNILVLLYILVSGLNSRAAFDEGSLRFIYRDSISWLPHSYDSHSTWFVFWQALGLTFIFWALHDWLSGKTKTESTRSGDPPSGIPDRLRRLLWVLSLNAALVAIEGIIQRLSGSNKVLFLVIPRFDTLAESQFGPWAYRSNAAQYFNLVWPVTLGFWFWLVTASERRMARSSRMGADARLLLLPTAILLAATPIISSSRASFLVSLLLVLGTFVLLVAFRGRASLFSRMIVPIVLLAALGLGAYLGWDQLKPRLDQLWKGDTSGRGTIYTNAIPMVGDYFVLGSGPGTFPPLYQLYRKDPSMEWEAYAHNDWLEFLITFGIFGESLLVLILLGCLLRYFRGGGMRAPGIFYAFLLLSLYGCLLNALVDFPLRIYSILFVFILLCAIASTIGRRASARAP